MTFSRRVLLAALGVGLTGACSAPTPSVVPGTPPARRIDYGPDAAQYGMLHLPAGGGARPVVVVIHGGYWQQTYGLDLGTPLAVDLTNHGLAVWNVEYRRLGAGGGFPATFDDVAVALDALAGPVRQVAGDRIDPTRTVLVGHSAGGQLAVWAASRDRLPAGTVGANPAVRPVGVVAQAGVLDLVAAADQGLGGTAVPDLLGGSPSEVPARYAVASPVALVPATVPVTCVHGRADVTVPLDQSERYVSAATRAGGRAVLAVVEDADHFALIDPRSPAWARCRQGVTDLLG